MKKITFLLMILSTFWTFAQVNSYSFSQSTTAYTEITGGTSLGTTTTDDQHFVDVAVPAGSSTTTGVGLPIGFDFSFNGVVYDSFAINANGWISLGTTTLSPAVNNNSSSGYTPLSSTSTTVSDDLVARISALGKDLQAQTGASISFETIGTAPNQTLVVQWLNYRKYNATGDSFNFQIRLNETTNKIDIVYGSFISNATTGATFQVGLRAAPAATTINFSNRAGTTSWDTTTSGLTATSSILMATAIIPSQGLTYTWTPPTCGAPSGLVVNSITTSGANVSWNASVPSPLEYEYVVSTSATEPTTAGTVTTSLNQIVTGLNPNTVYNVFLRSKCSATDSSIWIFAGSFKTLCNDATAFSENFDSYTTGTNSLADCWSKGGTAASTVYITTGGVTPGTAPNRLYMFANGATPTEAFAVLPPVSNLQADSHRLKLTAYASAASRFLEVGYLTDASDVATFVMIETLNLPGTTAATAQEFIVIPTSIPAGVKSLAFRNGGIATGSSSIYIDNVVWEPVPSCPDVTALSYSGVASSSVDVAWNAGGSETSWQYVVGVATVTDPTTLTPVDVTVANATINSLTPQTAYKVWVRSNCGSGSYGAWLGPITFSTACLPMATLPWTENFDALTAGTNVFPSCWSYVNTTSTWFIATDVPGNSGANSLRRSWSTNGWAFTPMATLTAGTSYTFSYYMRTKDAIVGYDVTIGAGNGQSEADMTETLSTVTGYAGATWTKFTYEFIPTTTGDYSFGIHVVAPSAPNGINFDDFKLELTPSCVEPSLLVASDVTASTGMVSWTEPAIPAVSGYEYYVATTNTAPTATSAATGSVAAGITMVNLALLTPSTTYYVWVRSVCSATDSSSWSTPISFLTACLPMTTLPWSENFDTLATGTNVFPSCWSYANTTSTWTISTSPVAHSGANSLRRTWSTDGWAFTPMATLTAGTSYSFSYYMRTNDAIVGYDVTVGAGNGQSDVDMTETLSTVTGYAGIAWTKFTYEFIPTTTGDYSFGIHVVAPSAPNGINFDDLKLELTPSCVEPTALTVLDLSATTVSFSWTEPTVPAASGYEYYVATTNTAPTTTTVATGAVAAGVAMLDLSGLTPSTTYYVWVRSVCSVSEQSSWSTVLTFSTLCASVATDYVQDFATFTPLCWSLAGAGDVTTGPTGTAEGIWATDGFLNNGSTGAVKVNLYNTARIGWMVSPTFNLAAGNKRVSFDYAVTTWGATTASAMGSDDSVKLVMSEDDGATWVEVVSFDATSAVSNTTQTYSHDLTSTSATVKFALVATDGTVNDIEDYDFFIDNFKVETTLSTGTFNDKSFSYYPNPVKDILNVSYNQNITNVAVFNLLGQQVVVKTVNANQGQIDMSNLSNGTYLVKITADNQVKTIKVVKQ